MPSPSPAVTATLQSPALASGVLQILGFDGREALSEPYEFRILVRCERPESEVAALLGASATFRLETPGQPALIRHGRIASLKSSGCAAGSGLYEALLVPRLWELGLDREERVFLDRSLPQILEDCLREAELKGYLETRLKDAYATLPYTCQYGESTLAFLSRLLEREGIAYRFRQAEDKELFMITDGPGLALEGGTMAATFQLRPQDAAQASPTLDGVFSLVSLRRVLPRSLRLRGFDERSPTLAPEGEQPLEAPGLGTWYQHGERLASNDEALRRARIRGEQLACEARYLEGEGNALPLEPGIPFLLVDATGSERGGTYRPVEVRHQGTAMAAGSGDTEGWFSYRNTFKALSSSQEYRPPLRTPLPRVPGCLPAFIDAEGGGTPELDPDQGGGRYRVRLPFDRAGHLDGHASAWVPLLQPTGGEHQGFHMPLRKGTPVLLTFLQGDPDRPAILGVLPSAASPSPSLSTAPEQSFWRSQSDNEIRMVDTPGESSLDLKSPREITLKAEEHIGLSTPGLLSTQSSASCREVLGHDLTLLYGNRMRAALGGGVDIQVGPSQSLALSSRTRFTWSPTTTCDMGDELRFGYGHQRSFCYRGQSVGFNWQAGVVARDRARLTNQALVAATVLLGLLHSAYVMGTTVSAKQGDDPAGGLRSAAALAAITTATELVGRAVGWCMRNYDYMPRQALIQVSADQPQGFKDDVERSGEVLLGWKELLPPGFNNDMELRNRSPFLHELRINHNGLDALLFDKEGALHRVENGFNPVLPENLATRLKLSQTDATLSCRGSMLEFMEKKAKLAVGLTEIKLTNEGLSLQRTATKLQIDRDEALLDCRESQISLKDERVRLTCGKTEISLGKEGIHLAWGKNGGKLDLREDGTLMLA